MSTPTITPVVTQLHPISTYLKAHERLVIVSLLLLASWFVLGKVQSVIAAHDNANLQQAKVVAVAQAENTQALAAQANAQAAQFKALAEKVQEQNSALVTANTELATALAKQQKVDASLPPTELANRWAALVPVAKPVVTATGLAVDTPGAIATVQQLEIIPVQQETIKNTQQELSNAQSLVTAEGQQVVTLNAEVGSLGTQLGDNAKVCTAQIATVKAQAAKSKRRWFYAGVVVGFVGRQLIKAEMGW